MDDIIDWNPDMMLEIELEDPDDFLKVMETLTRIGVSSERFKNTLYQSCHILHKQGRYFIVHFKELFILDGRPSQLSSEDILKRNAIATLLADWGLIAITDLAQVKETSGLRMIKIISYKEKKDWSLEPKYNIGNVKKK